MEAIFGPAWVPCLVLALIGIALLVAELFLPGFGVSGITGVVCLIAVCVLQFTMNRPLVATIVAVVFGVILIVMVILFMYSLKKGVLFRSPIVLKDKIEADAVKLTSDDLSELVGKTGVAVTPLRPSGIALIEGKRYSVETQATFTDRDQTVTVVSVEGTKITVQ